MFLIIDIGNTNITLGLADDNNIKKICRVNTNINISLKECENVLSDFCKNTNVNGCIISSVVIEINNNIKQAVKNVLTIDPIFLNQNEINIGVNIKAKKPEDVGADRIANAYAALKLYGYPAIIVDIGTATTFDIVDKNGDFSGGIIMPGIRTQLNSLCEKTSLLPHYEPEMIDKVIGNDTKTCILSGVIRGHAAAIDGLLEDCKKELNSKDIKIIGTGGDLELVSKYMKQDIDYINNNLTLDGIRMIYKLNS